VTTLERETVLIAHDRACTLRAWAMEGTATPERVASMASEIARALALAMGDGTAADARWLLHERSRVFARETP
jgi:hypothetical protein